MKALLVGANGQVGRELMRSIPSDIDLIALARRDLDISDFSAVRERVEALRPQIILNAAAYTAVDRAESEVESAFSANHEGARHLAEAAMALGARMVHISTDFIFDGETTRAYRPDDAPNPVNVYGASKLAGEVAVREITRGGAAIIRTSWVYSVFGSNFVKTILKLARSKDFLNVVDDQLGTPSSAAGIASAIWQIVHEGEQGIFHWSDAGVASWYDFAIAIVDEARMAGLLNKTVEVCPIPTSGYPTPARRPRFSVLDKHDSRERLKLDAQHWRLALRRTLAEMKAGEND